MAARAEVTATIKGRYAESGRVAKGAILDGFVMLTGPHRKHAIRLLGSRDAETRPRGRPKMRYDHAVKDALALLWEASDRVCSKRPQADGPGPAAGAGAAWNLFPFPVKGADFDNDGAFINEPVVARVAGRRVWR